MKSFAERNPRVIGAIGVALIVAVALAALNTRSCPFSTRATTTRPISPTPGACSPAPPWRSPVSGSGKVSSIELDGPRVLVTFDVDKDIHARGAHRGRDQDQEPAGRQGSRGHCPAVTARSSAPIPIDRTTSPYQLPDALGDLATTIGGLNTDQLSDSLATLAQTFSDTPAELKIAVQGVARFSQTLNERDANLRRLLENANKATGVLAERSDQVVSLVSDTNALLAELRTQSAALDQISVQHLGGWRSSSRVHRREPTEAAAGAGQAQRRARDRRQPQGARATGHQRPQHLRHVARRIGLLGPLLQGLHRQPAARSVRSTVHRCRVLRPRTGPGHVCCRRSCTDPQTGQPGTPALPVPYPRTGQGGEPHLTLPDAITGNPGDQGCGPPGCRCPARRLLPVPRAAAGAAARRPTARAARTGAARAAVRTRTDARAGLRAAHRVRRRPDRREANVMAKLMSAHRRWRSRSSW